MIRGYSTSRDVVPAFLQAFDVDDGRAPCPLRTQTVTAPQALFMMNSDVIDKASAQFAERLEEGIRRRSQQQPSTWPIASPSPPAVGGGEGRVAGLPRQRSAPA